MKEHAKALISALGTLLIAVDQVFGTGFGNQEGVTIVLSVLATVLVWLVPNKRA